jgi:hypothetical protein
MRVLASSWLVSVYKHTCILISWVNNVFINQCCFLPVFPRRNFELGSYPYAIHGTMTWQVGRWWVTCSPFFIINSNRCYCSIGVADQGPFRLCIMRLSVRRSGLGNRRKMRCDARTRPRRIVLGWRSGVLGGITQDRAAVVHPSSMAD